MPAAPSMRTAVAIMPSTRCRNERIKCARDLSVIFLNAVAVRNAWLAFACMLLLPVTGRPTTLVLLLHTSSINGQEGLDNVDPGSIPGKTQLE